MFDRPRTHCSRCGRDVEPPVRTERPEANTAQGDATLGVRLSDGQSGWLVGIRLGVMKCNGCLYLLSFGKTVAMLLKSKYLSGYHAE